MIQEFNNSANMYCSLQQCNESIGGLDGFDAALTKAGSLTAFTSRVESDIISIKLATSGWIVDFDIIPPEVRTSLT